ncbi:unnamed protein product [Nyctereutes procyonoides]|uniref:(raccoon dog) hypothetical protein n=1 Tax=Nyctereutes procyonoides TaxID=34880 RepID=A0A811XVP3_NYCPR|nr:unnamed protein product [Nyctereutes procyonoides]
MSNFEFSNIEWITAVTIAAGTVATGYPAYKRFCVKDHCSKSIQKDSPKIIHDFDTEGLRDKAAGDNMRPLIMKKKET